MKGIKLMENEELENEMNKGRQHRGKLRLMKKLITEQRNE